MVSDSRFQARITRKNTEERKIIREFSRNLRLNSDGHVLSGTFAP